MVLCCELVFKSCGILKFFNLLIIGSVIMICFVLNSVYSVKGFYFYWIGSYKVVRKFI